MICAACFFPSDPRAAMAAKCEARRAPCRSPTGERTAQMRQPEVQVSGYVTRAARQGARWLTVRPVAPEVALDEGHTARSGTQLPRWGSIAKLFAQVVPGECWIIVVAVAAAIRVDGRRGDGRGRPARRNDAGAGRAGALLRRVAARFAAPRYIDLVAELPRTENGKMRKYQLRDRGVTPTCWDRAPRPR